MKTIFEFKTLTDFTDYFKDEATCVAHFTAARFRNGQYCPHCRHDKVYLCANGKRYHCAKCKQDFTIRTKTVFGESKLPIRKWYMAIYLLATTSKGISSVQLAKHVGVTQKTGWFMDHRIRKAMKQNKGQLFGPVEVDETYVGGLKKNMHAKKQAVSGMGTGGKGKTVVFGMRSRSGEVRAEIVRSVDGATLHPIIKRDVVAGETVYTDDNRAYNLLQGFNRTAVNHSAKIYVCGDAHTNGIESFWALFKRGYHGVYHHMSRKHLQKYIDECAFRLNRKGNPMSSVFADVVANVMETSKLSYNNLTKGIA